MMSRAIARRPWLIALLALPLLVASVASAQPQPGQPQPAQPQPAQPQPGRPGPPPNVDAQPQNLQQPVRVERMPGAPGQPRQLPPGMGRKPPPRPQGLPAGHPPIPGAAQAEPESHGDAHGGHCPGHGPNDSPGHINYYQGILGVNNQKSQSPNLVDRLFWRYHNDKDECDTKNQEPPLLAAFFNFGLLCFVLFRFGKGPVLEGLQKRKKTIMADIDSADELKQEAQKRLRGYEKHMSRIEDRRKELEEDFRLQWEAEKQRILRDAEEKGERLRRDARFRVEQERKQAQADLIAEAIDTSTSAAEELLKKRVQQADLDRLADEYLAGIGKALSAGIGDARKSS